MVKRRDMWYGHPSHHGNPNVTAFAKHKDVLYTTYTLYIYTLYKHIRYIHGVMAIPQAVHPSSSPLKAQVHHAAGRPARRSIEGLRLLLKASRDGRRADLGDSCWYLLTKNSQKHPQTKYGEISDVFRKTLDINELMVKSWEGAMLWFIDNDCHQPNQITSQQNLADCPLNYTFIQHTYWDDHVITFVGSPFHKHPTSRTPQNCTCSNRYKYHQVPNILMVRFYQYFTIHW